jgi:hypothetical protein
MDPPASPGVAPPWPPEWPARPGPWLVLNVVVLGILAAGLAGLAAVVWVGGERGTAAVFAGVAAVLALIVVGIGPRLRVRRRRPALAITSRTTESGERGVAIPYSAWWYGWVVALVAAAGAGYAALVAAVLLGSDTLARDPRMTALALVGLVAVPYLGWLLVELASGRAARGHVVLTPLGVHHRSLTDEESTPWDSVQAVSAAYERGPLIVIGVDPGGRRWRRRSRVGFQRRPTDRDALIIHGLLLAVDPAVLYHALRHYHAHPDHRPELATAAAVARIRGGEVN